MAEDYIKTGITLWQRSRCPKCGRFAKDTMVTYASFAGELDHVMAIKATCATHGVVEVSPEFSWIGE